MNRLGFFAEQLVHAAQSGPDEGGLTPVLRVPTWCSLQAPFFLELGAAVNEIANVGPLRIDCVSASLLACPSPNHSRRSWFDSSANAVANLCKAPRQTRRYRTIRQQIQRENQNHTSFELAASFGRQCHIQQTFVVGYSDVTVELPEWALEVHLDNG